MIGDSINESNFPQKWLLPDLMIQEIIYLK